MIRTFERRKIEPNRFHGVVVSESDALIMIHLEEDFDFNNGYIVIRRKDVSKSYLSESNDYCEKLIRQEGLWKRPSKVVRMLPLADWKSLMTALSGKIVIIENERKRDFLIGPIVACDDKSASIHYFNGCGQWQEIERVPYRSITAVKIGSRYANIHSRHLPRRSASTAITKVG